MKMDVKYERRAEKRERFIDDPEHVDRTRDLSFVLPMLASPEPIEERDDTNKNKNAAHEQKPISHGALPRRSARQQP